MENKLNIDALDNRLEISTGSNTDFIITFTNNIADKCLLEIIGNNNGSYIYLAISVAFSFGSVTNQAILKQVGAEYITSLIINGNIKISGLSKHGVLEVRVPIGFGIKKVKL